MTLLDLVDTKLAALREAFDHSFVEQPSEPEQQQLDFLAIQIGSDAYALPLSDIHSVHVGRKLVAAPSRVPALLGLAGFRGVLTPVYDLAQLLGYPAAPAVKWLAVVRGALPIGLAFSAFEAHLRVPTARLSDVERGACSGVRGAVEHGDRRLPLLHLSSLVEDLTQRIKAYGSSQER